ncbi:hypothetical protein VN0371_07680 [Helicobacter pylori]
MPLNEVAKNHAESGKDPLAGVKIITSGLSVKERTTKEDKYKLAFGFNREGISSSEIMIESYTLAERKSRLGILISPMLFGGNGSQISAVIIAALHWAKGLNKHSDAEWLKMIESRNEKECHYDTFDNMDRVVVTLFCNVIKYYAEGREEFQNDFNDFSPDGFWAKYLPKNKSEALFVAQLLCDGGINKYGLSCAGLTENLLKDIELELGLATANEVDKYLANLDKEGAGLKE